jgi:mono/diheme cytochrome c family protein
MRKVFIIAILILFVGVLSTSLRAKDASTEQSGESLFVKNCASCHPNGGNILNPKKSLYKKDLEQITF